MNRIRRPLLAAAAVAVLVAGAALAVAALGGTQAAQAAPVKQHSERAEQAIQASGFITLGQGTCFPDALLADCDGNITHQLKGPGGIGYFAPFLNQWVELDGTLLTCVVGDSYISVTNIEAKPEPCGQPPTPTPAGPAPTATPAVPPPPGPTPSPTPAPAANLALGKAVFASSAPDPARPPEAAVDGDPDTHWASIPDPQPIWNVRHVQWIYVDLDAEYDVKNMRMLWLDGRHPRVYAVYVWREAWRAWQWVARTEYGKPDDPVTFPFAVQGRYFMLWLEVPHLAGSHYELREWHIGGDVNAPVQATNIAAGKASIALSHEPGFEAGLATDADLNTEWRSSSGLPQWLYVDLTTTFAVERAILRWVTGMHATSYTLYAWVGSGWQPVYATTRGTGADETVTFRQVHTRYMLLYATAGPSANVGLRELEVYEPQSGGGALPRPLGGAAVDWAFAVPAAAADLTASEPLVRGLRLLDHAAVPEPDR